MSFRVVSIAAAVLFAALAIILLLAPDVVYWLFELSAHETADFLAKRAAMLFLGLACLSALTRDAPASSTRRAISISVAISFGGLAVLGLTEFARGFAGPGIFLAVGVELTFALAYVATSARHEG